MSERTNPTISTEGTALPLLAKKSWNVWSQKNRDRVARDEAKIKEKMANIKAKQDKVDSEIFHDQLKKKAFFALGLEPPPSTADSSSSSSSSSFTASSATFSEKKKQKQQQQWNKPRLFSHVLNKRRGRVDSNGTHFKVRESVRKDAADPMQGLARARRRKRHLRTIEEQRKVRQKTKQLGTAVVSQQANLFVVDRSGTTVKVDDDARKREERKERKLQKRKLKHKKKKKKEKQRKRREKRKLKKKAKKERKKRKKKERTTSSGSGSSSDSSSSDSSSSSSSSSSSDSSDGDE
jgi:hypothetical protein